MLGLLRILLVEDNLGDIRLVQEGLKESGISCDLQVFNGGEPALEFAFREGIWWNEKPPNIIILDLNLPGMDGAEILRRLKSDERTRSIPVIMFSSSVAAADIHRCYDLHANCYIQKPMDLETVFQVVKSIETFWASVVELPNS